MSGWEPVGKAARIIADCEHLVAMTGAGMSVESGIPTFRGPGGMWTRHGAPAPDSYSRWLSDPDGWWSRERDRSVEPWVIELRNALDAARPHAGHRALARLEEMGVLRAIITQNIDGLHQAAGSKSVIEIHGSRHKLRCVDCGIRTPRPGLFMTSPPPPCGACGGRVKFDSVLFGEPVPPASLSAARKATDAADCVLAIGTSSSVRPAGGLPRIAHANGAVLIEVNTSETSLSRSCVAGLRGTAAAVLPALLAAVRDLLPAPADAGRVEVQQPTSPQ